MPPIGLKHRIGLVYTPGALPCFEDFGGLPTHLVREDGLVEGKPASETLDMLIIPGGSLVESGSVKGNLAKEIVRLSDAGKFIIGVCAGFQVLAKSTDTGRASPTPIIRHGLGLLDVDFTPMICTDRVKATVMGQSFMTEKLGQEVTGFHCHTYGKITLHRDAKPILVSHVKRVNYRNNPQDIVSGVANKEGNVVGVLIHALLDENPSIRNSIIKSLEISPEELEEIRKANMALKAEMKREVGVSTGLTSQNDVKREKVSACLLFTATESGAGKTFILAGVAGALKKRGFNVSVLKVGGDIRDIVPSFYLIKEPMRRYSSLKIGDSGWKPLYEAVEEASRDYGLILIEGAMGDLTGLLNEEVEHPFSTVEVALALDAPTVLVIGCEKSGIEGALTDAVYHVDFLRKLGVNVVGVVLNKVRLSYMGEKVSLFIDKVFKAHGVELLAMIPRMELEERGMIPEVEIRYEDFGAKAMEAAERFINLDRLVELVKPPKKTGVDFKNFLENFKKLLLSGSMPPSDLKIGGETFANRL
ncbi:MAG: AAA family ATPase [Candidatus Bathyarchaeales archaeon]